MMADLRLIWALVGIVALWGPGCRQPQANRVLHSLRKPSYPLVDAARGQLAWGTRYDPRYVRIAYPNGDVPRKTGVCTDLVVRAYRGIGVDLQRLVHEDILRNPRAYPTVKRPDTNIDHRRVPNLTSFLRRHGHVLTTSKASPDAWKPGDLVWWKLSSGLDHIGILSDRLDRDGFPFVVHNIGPSPSEDDVLREPSWKIVGHYRFP